VRPDDDCYELVLAAEQYADGVITDRELDKVAEAIRYDEEGFDPVFASWITAAGMPRLRFWVSSWLIQAPASVSTWFHDIFGNPFRPATFDPAWRTNTAVSLARQTYESRDFSAMPILADALQEAGCDNTDLLDHCRCSGPHVRGCWVVDLVLGKA
jgi:hypothetical protein